MDIEMTALPAAAAMASLVIEPENQSLMMASFALRHVTRASCCRNSLLQRILIGTARCVVLGQRIRSASLGKLAVFLARRLHHRGKTHVSFDAAGLVINPVFLIVLLCELLLDCPRTRPHGRVVDGDDIFERGGPGPRPALDEMQVLARAPIIVLRTEVRH